ncbi:FAD binding domain-containing protein [Candidatus Bipolaricaulota bacterium]|nr:FAD binding domain-containing protein [Candidatus Bipolaricaulota bacterium]
MTLNNLREYVRPDRLDMALSLIKEEGRSARVIGGGIDLVRGSSPEIEMLVDLSQLSLSYVRQTDKGIAIGAATTLTEILEAPAAENYLQGVVVEMLHQVGAPSLRNLASMGGTLASAHPWSDVITLFLVLGAQVTLYDGVKEMVPLSDLYASRVLLSPAIITEVLLPAYAKGTAAAFMKFSRTKFDIAILNCACLVSIQNGNCKRARVTVGGTPQLAALLPATAEVLLGGRLNQTSIGQAAEIASKTAPTRDDLRASESYRRELVYVGVKRCLARVSERLSGVGQ